MNYFCATLALTLTACGGVQSATVVRDAPSVPHHPCALELGTLEVPVPDGFALAAGDGACLLIDESRAASFVSIAALMDDEEGAALLQSDLREFLRASGVVGEDPRFTRRIQGRILEADVEVHEFVSTPPQLEERAGFAVAVAVPGGIVLFIGLSDSPDSAAGLWSTLESVRLASP